MTKSSPSIWHYVVSVKSTVKISSIFVAFLENTNYIKLINHFMILLQFLTILCPYKLCVNTEKRSYVNKRCNLLNLCLLKVLLSILFNELPEVGLIMAITAALVPFPVDRDRLICKVHGRKSGVIILLLLWWGMYCASHCDEIFSEVAFLFICICVPFRNDFIRLWCT